MGEFHVGVRASTPGMHALLRRLLAAHLTDDEAPANYSLLLADPASAKGSGKAFHFLYADATPVVRTRDPERLVRGLLAHLSAFDPDDSGDLHLAGVALVRNGEALIAPGAIRSWLRLVERRLKVRGFQVVDAPWLRLDPRQGAVVVPEPAVEVDWSALEGLGQVGARSGPPDSGVLPGTYPVRGWALMTPDGEEGPVPCAQAVFWASTLVLNRQRLEAQRVLDGLASVMKLVQPVGVSWSDEQELVGCLDQAAHPSAADRFGPAT